MAKKKSSAKKAVKKVVKKVAKKVSKKTPAKKTSAKKPVVKKSPTKKAAPKAAKKSAPKKAVAKKAASPKKTVKAPVKKASEAVKPSASHLVTKPAAKKLVDLKNFVSPLDDRLIVQTADSERMTAGGLYIPDTVADVSGNLHGTVVAVGRGHVNKKGHLRPMELKVGDKVVFSQYSGSKINLQNEDLIILRETEVMGVVEK
ncbi:co-chaperone GroES [Bdellovibrio sp. SKB1291214]|uniref:co-chaperone GroES n=1 Tax=Bdellovibrio sp. SKB1291214 TaxID=1732569 RepID=UPI000B51E616|nr:co-chaperone GroES [Bdellovibrio sp. SKB1291214]UYL08777.1 co-chaperone GroES [Bdellovibrio sp. SKB1291214]